MNKEKILVVESGTIKDNRPKRYNILLKKILKGIIRKNFYMGILIQTGLMLRDYLNKSREVITS